MTGRTGMPRKPTLSPVLKRTLFIPYPLDLARTEPDGSDAHPGAITPRDVGVVSGRSAKLAPGGWEAGGWPGQTFTAAVDAPLERSSQSSSPLEAPRPSRRRFNLFREIPSLSDAAWSEPCSRNASCITCSSMSASVIPGV